MNPYDAGTAIYLVAKINNINKQRVDPDSVNISIIDSSGSTIVDAEAMTKVTTGEYSYVYQSSATSKTGNYRVKVNAVDGSYTSVNDTVVFALE